MYGIAIDNILPIKNIILIYYIKNLLTYFYLTLF